MDRKGYQNIEAFQGCIVKAFKCFREWRREDPMAGLMPIVPEFDEAECDQNYTNNLYSVSEYEL